MAAENTIEIVCLGKRTGGTKVEVYGKNYHFKPADASNPDAPHVCAIPAEDARQIHRLLSIKDHYVLLDPSAELPAKPAPAPREQNTIAGEAARQEEKPVIIKNGDESINLSELDKEALAILARDTFNVRIHHKWDKKTLIGKIIEAMRATDE